ncbi:MAG: hypothetical protein JST23_03630 [Bacteroidetes bacterium]|nr:hypothetical protein [Bacteroidota bacterium]
MLRSFLFSISIIGFLLAPLLSKKEQLLRMSKKYLPEYYAVIKESDDQLINQYATKDSLKYFLEEIPTIVHELWHNYQSTHFSYQDTVIQFRINDTLKLKIKNFKTFPSNRINSIVPAATRKNIFRYDTYVNAKSKYHVTQQFGIFGLLEEALAYYHSYHTTLLLFNYYADTYGWKNPEPWVDWLSNNASIRFSIAEFKLFISWYLQYAQKHEPDVFKNLKSSKGLKDIFQFLESEENKMNTLYVQYRNDIINKLNGKLYIEGDFVYNKATRQGKGMYDEDLKKINTLLAAPEHKILDLLR